LVVIKD